MRTNSSQAKTTRREPPWESTADLPEYSPLEDNTRADVAIVGAGIAGLSAGWMLSQTGKSVVILDDGSIASGMTGATTAHLTHAIDDRYFQIERLHGAEGARLAAESHTAAIDRIESIVQAEALDCDFERLDGYLFLTPGEDLKLLDSELSAAWRAGLREVQKVVRAPLTSFDTGPCLRFPRQAQFHPLKYLTGLARGIERKGGRIFTKTHVDEITGGREAQVKARDRVVSAGAVIVATNVPINDLLAIHTKQAPYMTYAIGARVPSGSVVKGLYWDTGKVSKEGPSAAYHYVRLQRFDEESELLIVGGEDHKSGQANDTSERHARLERWARERFPMIQELAFTWGGQVMETIDGLAFIGRNPMDHDNVFVVTGDSGMGMTHGTIAGMLLTDLILGRPNPWANLYDPARKTVGAAGTFASEALNTVLQYGDWVTGGDVGTVTEIPRKSGAILRRGLGKLAVYRDEHGKVHERSAVCPHLGCLVHWNSAEKTWDCPCHGSRFTAEGGVLNGPSNQDLAPVEAKEPAPTGAVS